MRRMPRATRRCSHYRRRGAAKTASGSENRGQDMTIKRITAANENKVNGRTRRQAQAYWAESHGKLVANNPNLKRYHHYFSVPEAYDGDIKPTFMGISMFWRDDPFLVQAFPPPDCP